MSPFELLQAIEDSTQAGGSWVLSHPWAILALLAAGYALLAVVGRVAVAFDLRGRPSQTSPPTARTQPPIPPRAEWTRPAARPGPRGLLAVAVLAERVRESMGPPPGSRSNLARELIRRGLSLREVGDLLQVSHTSVAGLIRRVK